MSTAAPDGWKSRRLSGEQTVEARSAALSRGRSQAGPLGDASGTVEASPGRTPRSTARRTGRLRLRRRQLRVSERWGAKIKLTALREARTDEYDDADLATGSEVPLERLEADLRQLLEHRPEPPAARAARPLLRRGLGDVGALPRRAGGEGLPPGLPPRAARAHALGRAGGLRRGQLLPRHRPRRRRHRRAAPRHRQDRGLQRRPAGDRPHRPRSPAGRDPARLLPGPPPDRGHPRLRPLPRPGGPSHHPQPPRLARARLARSCPAPARPSSST